MEFYIEQLKTFSPDVTQVVNDLLIQLNPTSKILSDKDIKEIVEGQSNQLFVARRKNDKKIVGMLTLVIYRIPVWRKGWLEDIVVDKEYRNKGIATQLIKHAIEAAKDDGVLSLNFTSNPNREAANSLYQRLGFEKRNTNVYWIKL